MVHNCSPLIFGCLFTFNATSSPCAQLARVHGEYDLSIDDSYLMDFRTLKAITRDAFTLRFPNFQFPHTEISLPVPHITLLYVRVFVHRTVTPVHVENVMLVNFNRPCI